VAKHLRRLPALLWDALRTTRDAIPSSFNHEVPNGTRRMFFNGDRTRTQFNIPMTTGLRRLEGTQKRCESMLILMVLFRWKKSSFPQRLTSADIGSASQPRIRGPMRR
jgi:hypothetical protein